YAQRQAMQRRHVANALPRIDAQTWVTVEARLRKDWSPEQIAGTDEVAISTERIYQHIAADRQRGGTLWQHLRRRKQRRRHRCGTPRERQRFGGWRIHERPAIVEQRGRVGDWEGDTIVGKRLERGRYGGARSSSGVVAALSPAEFQALIEGLDWVIKKRLKRWSKSTIYNAQSGIINA
ncbi:MAG: IS30 family transposase, partial [Rhodanobacteraceae bacterium]